MKKLIAILLSAGVVLGLASVSVTEAATATKSTKKTKNATLVKAVDLNGKTITVQENKYETEMVIAKDGKQSLGKTTVTTKDPEVFAFNDMVQVTVDGKLAKIADVRVGMKVSLVGSLNLVNRIDAETYSAPVTDAKKR